MVALLGLTLLGAPPATAALTTSERVVLPPRGQVTLVGHGYGHGIGMSQYGARGAASRGVAHRAILDFYYPGTVATTQASGTLRVRLTADTDNDLRVVAAGTMTVTDGTGVARPLTISGASPTQWRVVRRDSGMGVDGLVGGTWRAATSPLPMPLTIASSTGTVRVVRPDGSQREYRGSARAVANGNGLASVNIVPLESYLRSVVPAEMPSSWPAEALRAQAVAARTYAARDRSVHGADPWDTCDSTQCQVYSGYRSYSAAGALTSTNEQASTDAAISATANQVRTYNGALAFTQFSSSNGGWTATGSMPYLAARQDPWDGIDNPVHTWSLKVSTAQISAAYPQVGVAMSVVVTSRNGAGVWGGRVDSVTINGNAGSTKVTGAAFRTALGLRSGWWKVTGSTRLEPDSTGDGRPDILARTPAGALFVYEGTGTGGFATSGKQIGWGWQAMRLVVHAGDLTNDGNGDVIAVDSNQNLWLYPADGVGGFGMRTQIGARWQNMTALVASGDMTSDGNADVLAVDATGGLWLYSGNGAGALSEGRRIGFGWQTMTAILGAGDLNDDGTADLLARDRGGYLLLYPGLGDGRLGAAAVVGNGWAGMRLLTVSGDWTGDGRPDVLAAGADGNLFAYPWLGRYFDTPRKIGWGWAMFDRLL